MADYKDIKLESDKGIILGASGIKIKASDNIILESKKANDTHL